MFAQRFAWDYVGAAARPIEAHFAYEKPPYADAYERLFKCAVRFGRARSEILFESWLLDEPQPLVNEPMRGLFKEHADGLLRQ